MTWLIFVLTFGIFLGVGFLWGALWESGSLTRDPQPEVEVTPSNVIVLPRSAA